MRVLEELLNDLHAEHEALDAVLDVLRPDDWFRTTPAPGWSVRDQVGHLAFVDERGAAALRQPAAFPAIVEDDRRGGPTAFEAAQLRRARESEPPDVLEWWRSARGGIVGELTSADPAMRVPWYGPPMSLASFATARLMETWAHGVDVTDALGLPVIESDRLRHVADLGVRTRAWSYTCRDLPPPDRPVRVDLVGPSGQGWSWGPEEADSSITGAALDFCLVVTQRRHVADTELSTDGADAEEWLSLAQAYAGPPGRGRSLGSHADVETDRAG